MSRRPLRVIALLATYNEERFVSGCIEHLVRQGVNVYMIDNESTDRTVACAQPYLGRGLIEIETLPRRGEFSLVAILERKEELAATLDADWFMHHDADEIRIAPRSDQTLVEALSEVDAAGCNAVNFLEFTFLPTVEAPEHDHPRFQETMRHYYAFFPVFPHRLNAWRRQSDRVELAWSGGHRVRFPGLRIWSESFRMRHYLFLGRAHAGEKYAGRIRTQLETERGWGGWRTTLAQGITKQHLDALPLPRQRELREYVTDDLLDPSEPLSAHLWNERWAQRIVQLSTEGKHGNTT
jgi:glycosyltransferase involved in cell wall biosynthesis